MRQFFLPWQNKPVGGQDGVQVTALPFSTSSEAHASGSEPSGGDSASLELALRGSAAFYVSTGAQGTNASSVWHVWLARELPIASAHNISPSVHFAFWSQRDTFCQVGR